MAPSLPGVPALPPPRIASRLDPSSPGVALVPGTRPCAGALAPRCLGLCRCRCRVSLEAPRAPSRSARAPLTRGAGNREEPREIGKSKAPLAPAALCPSASGSPPLAAPRPALPSPQAAAAAEREFSRLPANRTCWGGRPAARRKTGAALAPAPALTGFRRAPGRHPEDAELHLRCVPGLLRPAAV